MAGFANLWANLNLNIQNFSTNLRTASSQANQFATNLKGQINGGLVEPAKKSKFEFKDVARIVQGIMISKVFYSGLNAIRNCTNAVWEFSQELEYARIAYSNLFGDAALAEEFINVLEDFAATTPFSFSESEAAAKRLLAYGIEYKNVMYVMQGVLSASSMQNNPQVIESVSRAIGQIYTKGRLMNEEMRQLAEAGIPAYEILAEKLGLTQKQLQNLGKQAIPAHVAINALVEGMTERFGGVVKASTTTMKGIISNIKDNATMITSGIFEPMYNGIKSVLAEFGQFLFTLREIYATTGVGGVFEALFPEELHGAMRQFAANLANVHAASWRLIQALGGLLKPILEALLRVYNAFAPILVIITNVLAAMVKWITDNATAMKVLTAMIAAAAAMWVVFKIKALAAAVVAGVITLVSKALKGLSIMLTFVTAHPFWALLITAIGLLVGLSGGFSKLSNSISGVFKKLTSIGGMDPDKILLPSQEERANELEKFNQALSGTGEAMDELADSTGKATKAAKGLLSFDEVFKLKEPDEGTDSGIEIPDFGDLGDLGDLGMPEIDDSFFDLFADDYVTKLINSLKEKIIGAGLGAVIGGALGSILGGPLGAKIGAIAGTIAGWFWSDLADALGLTDVGTVALPIATALGTAIGYLAGGPLGAVIGTAIGGLVGWIIDSITRGIQTGDWTSAALPIGTGLGAAIGFIAGGPAGAAIGAAIGALVGWIGRELINGFTNGEWNPQSLGTSLGMGIGAAIGFIAGGPAGAAIGAAVGALVGWIGGLIVDNWGAISQWFVDVGTAIGNWCVQAWTDISNWVSNTTAAIGNWVSNTWNSIITWCSNTISAIGNWVSTTWNSIVTWCSNTISAIGNWVSTTWKSITTWCSNTWKSITTWCSNTWNSLSNWVVNVWSSFITWASGVGSAISTWAVNTWTIFSNWCTTTWDSFTNWIVNVWNSFITWANGVGTTIGNWATNTWNVFTTWLSGTWSNITTWVTGTWNNFVTWVNGVGNAFSVWASSTWNMIASWVTGTWTNINNWVVGTWNSFTSWINNILNIVSNGLVNIWNTVANWLNNFWSNLWDSLLSIGRSISNWWNSLWSNKRASVSVTTTGYNSSYGHASGGVFNREHVARFAEGNKAEAIIPLENESAMQPFVDAVANGLTATLAPLMAGAAGGQSQAQPLYVGTLIADERGLRELERKMQIIRMQETKRRG